MSLKLKTNKAIPVALRLTLWYASIFTISSLIGFTIFYLSIAELIHGRTDADMIEDVDELALMYAQGGLDSLEREFNDDVISVGADNLFFRILSVDGKVLLTTDMSTWRGLPSTDQLYTLIPEQSSFSLMTVSVNGKLHPARVITAYINADTILQFGESLQYNDEFLEIFRTVILVTVPLIIVFSCFIGWFMSRKALQGVREVTTAAIEIANGNLHRRVPESGRGDEIDVLAKTFNTMLGRIQKLIMGMHEMTDNLAHDLRSPLARIRAIAESSLLDNPDMNDLRSVSGNTIEECDRLLHMINTMLDITESEAGIIKRSMQKVDISLICADACELFQPLAEDKGVELSCNISMSVSVLGSLQHLQRMIGNLLENAIKYTDRGGNINLDLQQRNGQVIINIADTGIGISAVELPLVFDRFYRCELDRSETGSGLGLSLAQAIAHTHDGNISIVSKKRQGTTITIVLPVGQ